MPYIPIIAPFWWKWICEGGMKMLIIMFVGILCTTCSKTEEQGKLFHLYKNENVRSRAESEEMYYSYEYIVKIKNHHNRTIVVPYIQYRLLPNEQRFESEIMGDGLVNIHAVGTSLFYYAGVDTLFPGETQGYFPLLTSYDQPQNKQSYCFITFRYYFLDDYRKKNLSDEVTHQEFFILFRDSLNHLHIHEPLAGFDPNQTSSHPIPK